MKCSECQKEICEGDHDSRFCKHFKPVESKPFWCAHWIVMGDDEYCGVGLWCATRGELPQRLDQEEDSFE